MLLTWMLALCTANALQPPVGWTALGPDRAVMVPADPGRGEVRELRISGGSLDPAALVSALTQAGEVATLTTQEPDGTVLLKLGAGRVARGRVHLSDNQATWYLVLAGERNAQALDADALLAAMIPRALPAALHGAVEVLPAGRDGSLWDPVATAASQPSGGTDLWGAPIASSPSAWGQSAALVGIWGGTVGGPWGGAEEYVFTLDATGRLRIEERTTQGSKVTEGTWASAGSLLRLSSYTSDPVEVPFELDGKSLGLTWNGQLLTLFPRR